MIEVPILLLVILALAVAAGLSIAFAVNITKRSEILKLKRELDRANTKPYKTPLVSDKKHGLHWLSKNTTGSWAWQCECGRDGKVVTKFDGPTPTEELAILQWKAHVETHEKYLVPTNEHSHAMCDKRFVGLWALFEKYRKACYCQNVNNELIVLNEEVKKLEKKDPEKDVQLEA